MTTWERPDEQEPWASRFLAYLHAGPTRSLLAIYNQERIAKGRQRSPGKLLPNSWRTHAKTWDWEPRAALFDAAERTRLITAYENERTADRLERLRIRKAARGKLVQALAALQPEQASWNDVINGLEKVLRGLQEEYDDLPTQRVATTISYDDIKQMSDDELERFIEQHHST